MLYFHKHGRSDFISSFLSSIVARQYNIIIKKKINHHSIKSQLSTPIIVLLTIFLITNFNVRQKKTRNEFDTLLILKKYYVTSFWHRPDEPFRKRRTRKKSRVKVNI